MGRSIWRIYTKGGVMKKNELWIKKSRNKNLYDSVKIITISNKKNYKQIKIELPTGDRIKVDKIWLLNNYTKLEE